MSLKYRSKSIFNLLKRTYSKSYPSKLEKSMFTMGETCGVVGFIAGVSTTSFYITKEIVDDVRSGSKTRAEEIVFTPLLICASGTVIGMSFGILGFFYPISVPLSGYIAYNEWKHKKLEQN